MKKTTIKVNGMVCTSCAMVIQDALEEQEGVMSAQASLGSANVVIYYAESMLGEDELKSIIVNQGYGVVE